MSTVAVIDYGTGNLRSVSQAVMAVAEPGDQVIVTGDASVIEASDRVVFPGQGAMGDCMRHLQESGLRQAVMQALSTKPVLAICIGLQMLFDYSDEGPCEGLGIFRGKVLKFPESALHIPGTVRLKVPQMGWNTVQQRQSHRLWQGIDDSAWFYFVHSYFVAPQDDTLTAATTSYGLPFVCAVARDNIFATQFHPEKSGESGLQLFANFLRWTP